MPNEDALYNLWNTTRNDFEIGDFDSFKSKMQDPTLRSNFYKTAGAKYDLGDYGSFETKVAGQPKQNTLQKLPSNMNPQQVKSFFSRAGKSLTDTQAGDIASMVSGKSYDEAMSLTSNYLAPKVAAPVQEQAPLVAAPRPGTGFRGEIEGVQINTTQNQEPDFTFNAVGAEIARPKTAAEVQENVAQTMIDGYKAKDKDLDYLFQLLDDGKLADIDLGPLGSIGLGNMTKQRKEEIKAGMLSIKSAENTAKSITNFATVKALQEESTKNIANLNAEINAMYEDPMHDKKVLEKKKKELDDQIIINQVSNNTQKPFEKQKLEKDINDAAAAIGALSFNQRAYIGTKNAALEFAELSMSILNSIGEAANKYSPTGIRVYSPSVMNALEDGSPGSILKTFAKNKRDELEEYKKSNKTEYLAGQASILDGLNAVNAGKAIGQTLGSMGAVIGGSIAAGPAGGIAVGYSLVYGDAVDAARKAGFNETEAEIYGQVLAIGSGLLEELPVGKLLEGWTSTMLKRSVLTTIKTEIKAGTPKAEIAKKIINQTLETTVKGIQQGIPEGITEVAQGGQEFITQLAYNNFLKEKEDPGFELPTLKQFGKQSAEAFVLGFFGGGGASVAGDVMSGTQSYSKLASAAIKDNEAFNNLNLVADGLLTTGKITKQERDSFVGNLKIAKEAKAALPKYIKDDNIRQRSIELILDKKRLEADMATVDPSMQDGYKAKLMSIQAELKSISDQKWKAPANPVIFSSVSGLEAMTTSLVNNSSKENSAGTFVSTVESGKGFINDLIDSLEENEPVAKPLIDRTVKSLEILAKTFAEAPVKTEMTQKAAQQAQELADQLKSYSNVTESVEEKVIPGLDISLAADRIALGVPIADLDFMGDVPVDIQEAYQGIMSGDEVSSEDANNVQNVLYSKYKELSDIKQKVQDKLENTTSKDKQRKLTESINAISEIQANLSEDIGMIGRYRDETRINEESTGQVQETKTKPVVKEETKKEQAKPSQKLSEQELADMEYDYSNPSEAVTSMIDEQPDASKIYKLLNGAIKFINKIAPNAKVYVHATSQEFYDALDSTSGKKNKRLADDGMYVGGADGKPKAIHFNLEVMLGKKDPKERAEAIRTFAHEAMHVGLQTIFGNDQKLFKSFQGKLEKILNSADLAFLDEFIENYRDPNKEDITAEEFLAELGGMMSAEGRKIPKPILARIAQLINNTIVSAARKLGITVDSNLLFKDTMDTNDVIDFFNAMAESARTGITQKVQGKAEPLLKQQDKIQDQELPITRARAALGDLRDKKHFMYADLKYPDVVFKDIDTESEANIAINFYKKIVDKFNKEFDRDVKIATEKTPDGRFAVVVEYETGLKPKYFSYPTEQMGEHHIVDALTNEVPLTSLRHELIHEMLVKHITDKFERINTLDKSADAATIEEVQRNRAFNYTLEDVFFERLVEDIERLPDGVDTFEVDTYGTDVTNRLNEEIKGKPTKEKVMSTLNDLLEGSNAWLVDNLNKIFNGLDYTKINDIRDVATEVGRKFKQRFNSAKNILPKDLQQKIYDFTELFNKEYQGVQTRLEKQIKESDGDLEKPTTRARKADTEAQVLFTVATKRAFDIKTEYLKSYTNKYDKLVKMKIENIYKMGIDKFNKEFSETAKYTLVNYAEILKSNIPRFKAKYNVGEPFLGSWQGFYEPSMNLNINISDDTDTSKLSDLFNRISEETSQDAYIIEMTSDLDEAFQKDENKLQLFEYQGNGISVYPQVIAKFQRELTPFERTQLAKSMKDAKFESYSIGPNFVKISVFDNGASNNSNTDRAKEREDRISFFNDQKTTFENAIKGENTYSEGVELSTQIKRSAFVEGKKTGENELQRKYDRRDVFKAFKPSEAGPTTRARKSAESGPARGNRLFNEPLADAQTIANKYYESTFGRKAPNYTGTRYLDTKNAKRISDAFIAMKHAPQDLEVAKAYRQMIKETQDQFEEILAAGYVVVMNDNDAYASSGDMIDDLRNNKSLNIFSTEAGFGDTPITAEQRRDNPLLAKTKFKDANGRSLLANDVFRFVHDFFGHAKLGNSFGAKGEENAWNVHARMYSPLARRAMTTETRGQNSYFNFSGDNKKLEALREKGNQQREEGDLKGAEETTSKIYEISKFADQKVGLMPEEFSQIDETNEGDRQEELGLPATTIRARATAKAPKDIAGRVGREGGLINGTNLQVKGTEPIKPGKVTFTIYKSPTKAQIAQGNTAGKRKETFGLEDIKNQAINSSSAIVNRAEMLSSGLFNYKYDEIDENNKKTGKKISGEYPLPYSNPKANKNINKLVGQIQAIPGKNDEEKAEKKRLLTKLKKEIIPVYQDVINTMAENIRALYDTLTPEFIEQSKRWYEGANRFANSLASTYKISVEQSSGMLAVLSPQKDWFNNVSAAERVMDIITNHSDKPFTKELLDNAVKYNTKSGKVPNWVNDIKKQFKTTEGMSINDMQKKGISMASQANLLRILDHYYNSPNVLQTTPDGQVIGYGESTIMWNPASEIGRAMMIFRDPAQSNIEVELGKGNKVRNFYNNIVDPNSENGYLTADTHALGVAFGLPTSANDAGAFKLFSGGEESIYAIVKDAYTMVAKEKGMLPRELQSITWEAFRTGVNDKNRTKAKNKSNFDMMQTMKGQGVGPYEITQAIINENRSTDPEWAKELGINTQKRLSEIRKGAGRETQQGVGEDVSVRGQQRERDGGADTSVVPDAARETVTRARRTQASKALEAYPELATTKVVNEDGTPKILYHGGLDFKGFRKGETKGDAGIYFTDNPDFALYFAHQAELYERDKRNDDYSDVPERLLETGDPFPEKYFKYAKVQKVYLDMKDPKVVDAIDARAIPNAYGKNNDGFIAKTTGDFGYKGGQYVVFEPSQIKDADPKVIDSIIESETTTRARKTQVKQYYNPAMAADQGTKAERDNQVKIYDKAKAFIDNFIASGGDVNDIQTALFIDLTDNGIDIDANDLFQLRYDVTQGNRPKFAENKGGQGYAQQEGTKTKKSRVLERIKTKLEKLSTNKGLNRKIINKLKESLHYTVQNQDDAMRIAQMVVDEFGGIDGPQDVQDLYDLSNEFSGAVKTFIVGNVLNEAYKQAKKAAKGSAEQLRYQEIINSSSSLLAERARDNGREIAALYKLYLNSPEGMYTIEAKKFLMDVEAAFTDKSQKAKIDALIKELKDAKAEAARLATEVASVKAAIATATGGPVTTPPKPGKPTTPKPPKPQTTPTTPTQANLKKERTLFQQLKDKLKSLGNTRSRRQYPTGVDPDVVDILSELARVNFERGIFDFNKIKDNIAKKLAKDNLTISDDHYTEMENDMWREARTAQVSFNAEILAKRIVFKAAQTAPFSATMTDPMKLIKDELFRRATQDIKDFDVDNETEFDKLRTLLIRFSSPVKPIWNESKAAVERQIDALDPTKYSDAAKAELRRKLDNFFNDTIANALPRSEKKITATFAEDVKDKQLKIQDILLMPNETIASNREEFVKDLVDRLVSQTGISYSDAQAITEAFTKEYDALAQKTSEKILARSIPKTKSKEKILNKSKAEKAFEMIKYGAIDQNASLTDKDGNLTDLNDLFSDIFGLPKMNDEIRGNLKAFAEQIAKTKPNSILRQQFYNDMMSYIEFQKIRDSMGLNIFMSQIYHNVLFSMDTMVKAFNSNFINTPHEFITQSLRAAAEGDFSLIPLIAKSYFGKKGDKTSGVWFREGMNNAKLTLSGMVETENFNTTNIAEVLSKQSDSPALKAWGKYARKSNRFLGAIDTLFTSAATGARITDLLYDEIKYLAKQNNVKLSSREISETVANIQGLKNAPVKDAIAQATDEFVEAYGPGVDINSKKNIALFRARVMEIVREGTRDRAAAYIVRNQWASELDGARIDEIISTAKELASKVGLVGNPPGTFGVLASILKYPGKVMPGSQVVIGNMFANAPMNAAEKILQGNTLVGGIVLAVRLAKNQRGILNSSDVASEILNKEGIRTEMYGRVTSTVLGRDVNMEKKEMIVRYVMLQALVLPISYLSTTAIAGAIAKALDDDDERKEDIIKNHIGGVGKISENERQMLFFGDKTADPGTEEYNGQWKNLKLYVTGPMYGYTATGAYSKMSAMKSMYGIEPYSVYSYGKLVTRYNDNPLLAAVFGSVGANNDVMLFNNNPEKPTETYTQMMMQSAFLQLNLVKDQAAIKPVMEFADALGGTGAYGAPDLESMGDRAKLLAQKKLGNLISNLTLPAEAKNFNQDIKSIMGVAADDPRELYEFITFRAPIIDLIINKEKTDSFGFPIEEKTKRVLPVGTQGLMYVRLPNGGLQFPQVDQIMNGPGGKYYAMFKKYDNDLFDKPGISSYVERDPNNSGESKVKKLNKAQLDLVRDEYKKLMREFCDYNYEELKSGKSKMEFDLRLNLFLSFYNNNIDGYKDYIIKKVIGENAFIDEPIEENIEENIDEQFRTRY